MSRLKTKIFTLGLMLLVGSLGLACSQRDAKQAMPPEKITIGVDRIGFNALLWIAKERELDKAHALELDLKTYQTGRDAITDLKAGRLDLACCAEFVLVAEIFAGGADLRCLSVLSSGEIMELSARRDRGVSRPEDLRGKTIGLPLKTSAEFFLGRFLTFNHLSLKEVTVVNINPFDLANALVAGKVDAVLVWEPVTHDIMKKMGHEAITWPAQGGQDFYWLLVSREEVIQKRAAALEKLMGALMQAANFVKEKPEAAREIIAHRMQVPPAYLDTGKFAKRYELFLDQALLLAMEDEARWLMKKNQTRQNRLPDFLNYFSVKALAQVDPKAVRIIIPKDGRRVVPTPSGTGQERR